MSRFFQQVSDEGDVLYVFPKDYRSKLASKSFKIKIEPLVEKAKVTFFVCFLFFLPSINPDVEIFFLRAKENVIKLMLLTKYCLRFCSLEPSI